MTAERIYLIGLMGSGKTIVGKELARQLKKNFVDIDEEIVNRNGVDIQTIFDIEGEEGFRNRESDVLEEVSFQPNSVISTGGGLVLRLSNRIIMNETGVVVYLKTSVKTLFERTKNSSSRPLLNVKNPKKKLSELYCKRNNLYSSLADITIRTDNSITVYGNARKIFNILKNETVKS